MKTRILTLAAAILLALIFTGNSRANEPDWYGKPLVFGAERARIKSLPMTERPYRPFHFYGNTVRRRYYRGCGAPMPRDIVRGTVVLAHGG